MVPSIKTLNWHKFLARPPLPSPQPQALDSLRNQRILITGAGGSIGSALALRLADIEPKDLVLLDASESRLFALQNQFAKIAASSPASFVLGDLVEPGLLEDLFTRHAPGLILHAAAYKHVPLLEQHPFAALRNNVLGTHTLVKAAAANHAHVLLLSTDKAVEPASILGATKRVAEHIVLANGGTVLRLANVLVSRDSVAEIFACQIAAGDPITVTDPAARRFFVTIAEAGDLLLTAATADTDSLFVPDLPQSHFVSDLARFMARELAPDREVPIVFTEPRPGDEESESLWSHAESLQPSLLPGLHAIKTSTPGRPQLQVALTELRIAVDARNLPAAFASLRSLVPEYAPAPSFTVVADPRHRALSVND